jgi:regulator of cell morphogenesis and NO signaling
MDITSQTRVGEIVVAHPETARVFEALGVDYCCGGKATLVEACASASLSVEEVLARLHQQQHAPADPEARAIVQMNVAALLDHLEQRHHTFTRSELERAERLLQKVLAAHGARHPELAEIAQTFEGLSQELAVHMQKEERILFPYLRALEAAAQARLPLGRPAFQSALNPIRVMLQEHDAAGIFLQRLRELTGGYSPPADACPTFRALYASFADLERDLHQHIHLENNVLFPRALPLEQQVLA